MTDSGQQQRFKVSCIWAWSGHEPFDAWLVEAWDANSIMDNPEGWTAALERALANHGMCWKVVDLAFDWEHVSRVLEQNPTVAASVRGASE
jgi:hypothetical protein